MVLGQALALAPGSSSSFGSEKNNFTTQEEVYFTHLASVMCGDDLAWKKNVTAYIISDNIELNDSVKLDEIASESSSVYIDEDSKIQPTIVWSSPEVGNWDIVLDINNDTYYDDECPDQIDDIDPIGFSVTEEEEIDETVEDTNTTTDITNQTDTNNTKEDTDTPPDQTADEIQIPQKEQKKDKKIGIVFNGTDYTPFVIIGVSVVIALIIIGWTLRKIR